jgi:hypothetical protein
MTPWFERVYHTEPVRESDCDREHKSIELSDEQILRRTWVDKDEIARNFAGVNGELIVNYPSPGPVKIHIDEKPKRKIPGRKPKKTS